MNFVSLVRETWCQRDIDFLSYASLDLKTMVTNPHFVTKFSLYLFQIVVQNFQIVCQLVFILRVHTESQDLSLKRTYCN
jgi:hypothetical protein